MELADPETMTEDHDANDTAVSEEAKVTSSPHQRRLQPVVLLVVFDLAGPLALYYLLRSAGWSAVAGLVLSGVPPAIGIALGAVRVQPRLALPSPSTRSTSATAWQSSASNGVAAGSPRTIRIGTLTSRMTPT